MHPRSRPATRRRRRRRLHLQLQRSERTDTREAARVDFEWDLGDHQLRFGLDHETNTSDHDQYYPGPDRLLYEVRALRRFRRSKTALWCRPAPSTCARARTRSTATFETINPAFYLEDNWSITTTVVLNAGLRVEGFDNKNSDGDSYIKIDDMIAPRFGFLLGHEGRQPQQAVRQCWPLLPAGRERDQHQAGRRLPR